MGAARDLFQGCEGESPWLSVQFIELRGNRCFDLLASCKSPPELKLRERTDGSYMAEGAVENLPLNPDELCTIMEMAQSRRATSATGSNDVSSRSHAICTLQLKNSRG